MKVEKSRLDLKECIRIIWKRDSVVLLLVIYLAATLIKDILNNKAKLKNQMKD